ncbi:hypothetical protein KKA14_19730 [bacterium]|nr:hypothetical protein [bacterium]
MKKSKQKEELIHSKHLARKGNWQQQIILHELTGTEIEVSPDMVDFLELFAKPTVLLSVQKNYQITNLISIIPMLKKYQFLVPVNFNEELQWLDNKVGLVEKKVIQSPHFTFYYSDTDGFFVRNFANMAERSYLVLKN